jgi:voltage-gated potassium channel
VVVTRRARARERNPWADLRWPGVFVVVVLVYGVTGYMTVQQWSFVDALYMTLMTLSTVGFEEVHPLSTAGELFTISLFILGVALVLVTLSLAARAIAEGALGERSRRRRMERRVGSMRDHFIICSYGRVGRAVAREFEAEGVDFVVIESNEGLEEQMIQDGVTYLDADATFENALQAAGIERARGLVCALDSDANNVYIALAARSLNAGIFIVGRASDPTAGERLYRAGADRVISPYVSSGRHMAAMALRPRVVDYLEVSPRDAPNLRLEELQVEEGSELEGRKLQDACGDTTCLAVRKPSREIVTNPPADYVLDGGDLLVLLGEREALRPVEGRALPPRR